MKHVCETSGHSKCAACVQFETALWEAINRYANSVGGDPSKGVYDNAPRMQAVVDVGEVITARRLPLGCEAKDIRAVAAVIEGTLNEAGSCCRTQGSASPFLPTNPDCSGTVGRDFVLCGEEGYYCSDRCWTIGRLSAAHAQVAEYERQLGLYGARSSNRRNSEKGRGAP